MLDLFTLIREGIDSALCAQRFAGVACRERKQGQRTVRKWLLQCIAHLEGDAVCQASLLGQHVGPRRLQARQQGDCDSTLKGVIEL